MDGCPCLQVTKRLYAAFAAVPNLIINSIIVRCK
jgi:hypothetical protein